MVNACQTWMMSYFNYCNCGTEGCPYSWVLGIDWISTHITVLLSDDELFPEIICS